MASPFSKAKYPNVFEGHKYAEEVVSGKIIASKFVIGACNRYLRDLQNTEAHFYFDPEPAEKYLRLVQKFEHVLGKWDTEEIIYEPWQKFVWMNIMGFIRRDNSRRRFRIAHIEVARGNAKSAMASQAALYFMALDNPVGNQVATVATKKEQARIVLDSARNMARKNRSFLTNKGVRVLAHSVVQERTNSVIRALAAEASGLDGLNDVLAVCDELHAMKRDVFEVISSGMSKRSDSLILCITTAGFDVDSVGYSQSAYAKKVSTGEVDDDQFFSIVYCIDDDDDIFDESCWIKANPNWGVSVDPVTFRAKMEKAKTTPADVPNLKVKHLNVWISEAHAFYDTKKWEACADENLKIEDFNGKKARMGIDLASHVDLTSIALIFYQDGKYFIFDRTYIPEKTVEETRSQLYDDSISKGYLIKTPGAAINFGFIRDEATAFSKQFRISECLYDTWNATEMAQKLSDKIEMVKFGMNTANLSEPMKKLDALMREGKIVHNGSPLVKWCIGNVVAKRDHNDNVFPRKSHVRLKIDPVIAILMALAGWLADENKESVYEHRPIRSF
jgi:phage terminase large subunit-like protein